MGAWGLEPWQNDSAADWFVPVMDHIAGRIDQAVRDGQPEEVRAAMWLLTQVSTSPYIYDDADAVRQAKQGISHYETFIEAASTQGLVDLEEVLRDECHRLQKLVEQRQDQSERTGAVDDDVFFDIVNSPDDALRVGTHVITLYVGRRIRYSEHICERQVLTDLIAQYCTSVGLCVSVTDTEFLYSDGSEPGLVIGLINYPRFPSTRDELLQNALALGRILGAAAQQYRVTVVDSDTTHTLVFDT